MAMISRCFASFKFSSCFKNISSSSSIRSFSFGTRVAEKPAFFTFSMICSGVTCASS